MAKVPGLHGLIHGHICCDALVNIASSRCSFSGCHFRNDHLGIPMVPTQSQHFAQDQAHSLAFPAFPRNLRLEIARSSWAVSAASERTIDDQPPWQLKKRSQGQSSCCKIAITLKIPQSNTNLCPIRRNSPTLSVRSSPSYYK